MMSNMPQLSATQRAELIAGGLDPDARPDLSRVLVTPERAAEAQRVLDGLAAAYPSLGELLAQLDTHHLHPLELLNWLLLPCPDLDEDGMALSPFDWLLRADRPLAPVLAAAP